MIKTEWPPNIERIASVFPNVQKAWKPYGDIGFGPAPDGWPTDHPDRPTILFAYGEDIYNPGAVKIPQWLLAHEYRHCARQFAQADAWWEKYLTDPEFRYGEELLAHVEEYVAQARALPDRNARAKLQQRTAQRLIAPLYNYQPPRSLAQAMRDIHLLAH